MVESTCIKRFLDTDDLTVIEYRLQDTLGNVKDVSPEQLKSAIRQNKIYINNLTLASNNTLRSADKRLQCVYINRTTINKIGNIKKSLYFKSNMNINEESMKEKALIIGAEFKHLKKDLYKIETESSIGIISNKQITLSKNSAGIFYATAYSLIDLSEVDASNVTDMRSMFQFCGAKTITFGKFDTSRVTDMQGMFSCNKELKELDMTSFDTSNVEDMSYIFNDSRMTVINITGLNVKKVLDMAYAFAKCRANIIGLNSLDVSRVEDVTSMFLDNECKILDLSNWNLKNVYKSRCMFKRCKSDTIDLSNINFRSIEKSYSVAMFENCNSEIITNNKFIQQKLKESRA